ncbi:hypothetical protein SCHPADRAFT_888635 [Schizopora paradoxa]|uniref:Uncharacterized protein n=1 Tax=Schizopora paradoxa TaxID=27342 RepID=A0A0H2S0G5_9AGAM|nr:hypothetical protein SCHPADRAFT_888635 [Schizopora paradoxa]
MHPRQGINSMGCTVLLDVEALATAESDDGRGIGAATTPETAKPETRAIKIFEKSKSMFKSSLYGKADEREGFHRIPKFIAFESNQELIGFGAAKHDHTLDGQYLRQAVPSSVVVQVYECLPPANKVRLDACTVRSNAVCRFNGTPSVIHGSQRGNA